MKILLLGSKPHPSVPIENDIVVFVNGSIKYYNEFDCSIFHVFGDSIFYWDSDIALINREYLKNKHVLKSWVIKYRNVDIFNRLEEINYEYDEIEYISYRDKERLTWNTLGIIRYIRNLIQSGDFFFLEKCKFLFYELLKNKRIKLSTGVFSLLLLLKSYPGAEICISGIGFGNDVYSWFKGINKRRGHYINDYCGFKTLQQLVLSNNIVTTELELNKLFKIPICNSHTKLL